MAFDDDEDERLGAPESWLGHDSGRTVADLVPVDPYNYAKSSRDGSDSVSG
ncbi:hypothetical protein ABZX40_38340 [Streptomyces sp. NPDC004610]|uniref:hypothetical protein n=1 Tax=unclassified Streptomyces TaxID=2593676 RepID=UPI00339DF609